MRKIPGAVELAMPHPTYLDAVRVYAGRFAGHSPTDPLRRIAAAGGRYHWRAIVCPDVSRQTVAALGAVEDQFTVAPGSVITAVSGSSTQAEGFTLQVIDVGTKLTLCQVPVGWLAGFGGAAAGSKFPNRPLPMYLTDLFPISAKGLVLIKIVNASTSANLLAACIQIAERHG